MGRPNVILEPTRTYNLLISLDDYEQLRAISRFLTEQNGQHVSIAHLLRDGAKSVIRYYKDPFEEENGKA
jgi:hypothetical protein